MFVVKYVIPYLVLLKSVHRSRTNFESGYLPVHGAVKSHEIQYIVPASVRILDKNVYSLKRVVLAVFQNISVTVEIIIIEIVVRLFKVECRLEIVTASVILHACYRVPVVVRTCPRSEYRPDSVRACIV